MAEPVYDKIRIVVGGEDVVLDPSNLVFNEATLGNFLDTEGRWYDYFGRCLALAEAEHATAKENAEVRYFTAFEEYKREGGTEKLAESRARIEPAVVDSRAAMREADRSVKLIKQHLRSYDHSHANAISMGHNIRKEMDKLSPKVYRNESPSRGDDRLEDVIQRYHGS